MQNPSIESTLDPSELTDILDDDDLVEVCGATGTRVMGQPYAPVPRLPPPPLAPRFDQTFQRYAPVAAQPTTEHPSFYPVAFPSSYPQALPKKGSTGVLVAALLGGAFVTLGAAAAITAVVVHRMHSTETTTAAATTSPVETEAPITTAATATAEPTVIATAPTEATATTPPVVVGHTAVTAPRQQHGNGVLRTFAVAAGQPVYVDGRQVGVGGPRIATSVCGKHSVVVGSGKPKTVDIPCNGTSVTVGTPDGR